MRRTGTHQRVRLFEMPYEVAAVIKCLQCLDLINIDSCLEHYWHSRLILVTHSFIRYTVSKMQLSTLFSIVLPLALASQAAAQKSFCRAAVDSSVSSPTLPHSVIYLTRCRAILADARVLGASAQLLARAKYVPPNARSLPAIQLSKEKKPG